MRFKTIRLTTVCNGLKQTISTSGGFWLLEMVSKPVARRCEALVGKGLDPLHSRRVLKNREANDDT